MPTITFDTLKASDTLKAAGVESGHAEAIVHTVADAFSDLSDQQAETVATKTDIAEVKADITRLEASTKTDIAELRAEIADLRTEVKTEIADLRTEVKTDIAQLRAEIFRALWIQGAGIVGLVVGLTKLL